MLLNEANSTRSSSKSKHRTLIIPPSSPTFQRSGSLRGSGKKLRPSSEIEIDENNFTPPDPDLSARIVEQLEFYFSDVNIMKDTFLLQHMKHNKDGYISLKLLSGFKRIKHLVKNWRELAYALENNSKLLQLNNERTKLRRIAPLPNYDETSPSRTIIAFNLPLEKPITIKNVVNLFSPCGRIVLVRILLPKNPIPADVRPYLSSLPDLQGLNEASALVEFADYSSIQCALNKRPACAQAAPLLWGSMKVLPLTQQQTEDISVNFIRNNHRSSFHETTPSSVHFNPQIHILTASGKTEVKSPARRNSKQIEKKCIEIKDLRRHSCPSIPHKPATPISERRRSNVTLPENVIRLPRGPDGTKGFRDRLEV